MTTITANINKKTKRLLLMKKQETGQSISKLVEFAVLTMPYIQPKKLKTTIKKLK